MTSSGVRAAEPDDADGIGATHLACWRETYAGLLSPEFFASRSPEQFAANWRRVLTEPGDLAAVLAEQDGAVIGFAASRPLVEGPAGLELVSLYLRAEHHGSGLGQALLDAAIGDRPAVLWVAEQNPRARRFYARNGFTADGARQVLDGWEGLVEVRLLR